MRCCTDAAPLLSVPVHALCLASQHAVQSYNGAAVPCSLYAVGSSMPVAQACCCCKPGRCAEPDAMLCSCHPVTLPLPLSAAPLQSKQCCLPIVYPLPCSRASVVEAACQAPVALRPSSDPDSHPASVQQPRAQRLPICGGWVPDSRPPVRRQNVLQKVLKWHGSAGAMLGLGLAHRWTKACSIAACLLLCWGRAQRLPHCGEGWPHFRLEVSKCQIARGAVHHARAEQVPRCG